MDPEQRKIERKLMNADENGNIVFLKFKNYFTAVPEDDLRQRVSSIGSRSVGSMQVFER